MSPETATFSKATPTDVVFTVTTTDTTATLSVVKNGSSVVNADNYTYAGGKVTIKATYLATLADGVKTFTITMSSGSDMVVTITVGA